MKNFSFSDTVRRVKSHRLVHRSRHYPFVTVELICTQTSGECWPLEYWPLTHALGCGRVETACEAHVGRWCCSSRVPTGCPQTRQLGTGVLGTKPDQGKCPVASVYVQL